jgi:hypothetical protein
LLKCDIGLFVKCNSVKKIRECLGFFNRVISQIHPHHSTFGSLSFSVYS